MNSLSFKPDRSLPQNISLKTATNTPIKVLGTKTLQICLGRRVFEHDFIVANTQNIIGLDFLSKNGFSIDCKNSQLTLRDTNTGFIIPCKNTDIYSTMATIDSCSINPLLNSNSINLSNNSVPISNSQFNFNSIPDDFKIIFDKYPNIFSPINPKIVKSSEKYQIIIKKEAKLPHENFRRLTPLKLKAAKKHFDELLDLGIISPSNSPVASPLHMVPKANSMEWRPTGDYRMLNQSIQNDAYPIPNIEDVLSITNNCTYFTELDLVKAFNQLPVAEEHKHLTAITTPFGLFEWNCMPFGLKTSAQAFQRFIDNVLRGIPHTVAYIDNILIATPNLTLHKQTLNSILQRLTKFNLKLNISKSKIAVKKIECLGYSITENGISPKPDYVEAVQNLLPPKTIRSMRQFLGKCAYYQKFIPNFATFASPLYEIMKSKTKNAKINLTPDQLTNFENLKKALANSVTLVLPKDHDNLLIYTDASDKAIGAVLQFQTSEGMKPCAFFSKKLSNAQRVQATFDRELFAAYKAVQKFRPFIEGRNCTLFTDHKPLVSALKAKAKNTLTPVRQRQLTFISEFVELDYVPGDANIVADFLSRPEDSEDVEINSEDSETINSIQLFNFDLTEISEEQLKYKEINPQIFKNLDAVTFSNKTIYCDNKTNYPRPFIPPNLVNKIIKQIHEIGHYGNKATKKMLQERYFWNGISKDVTNICKTCLICQQHKISRHTKSKIDFNLPADRLEVIHIDHIGPFNNEKFPYILTMIDRCTGWMEATPVLDTTAETTIKTLIDTWMTRYGIPLYIVTDRGPSFEAQLTRQFMSKYGAHRLRTTAYHPQTNGKVERLHKTLKTLLRIYGKNWQNKLQEALFALRIMINSKGVSPAELIFGKKLMFPLNSPDIPFFEALEHLKLVENHHSHNHNIFIPKALKSCSHVWLRVDRVKKPMEAPYNGPYEVISRTNKVFKIKINNQEVTVSIDRIKPVTFKLQFKPKNDDITNKNNEISNKNNISIKNDISTENLKNTNSNVTKNKTEIITKSGRKVKFKSSNDYYYF